MMQNWTPQQLTQALNATTSLQLLDVRESWEYDIAHISKNHTDSF